MSSKPMNIVLWVLQVLFAFYFLTGGYYMMTHYQDLANSWALNALPSFFWMILGVLEMLSAVGLVIPGKLIKFPQLTSIAAISLTVISLLGIVLYVAFTGVGMLWALLPAAVLAFVAYGRWPTKSK